MVFVILRFGKLLTEFSMIMFEGVTTIPKGSRAKWLEARDIRKDDEIVCSA